MRPINADKLYDKLLYDTTPTFTVNGGGQYIASFRVADAIESAPTLAYADLVPHGRWESKSMLVGYMQWESYYACTACGRRGTSHKTNYCPNCGALMDRGEDNEPTE